MGPAIEALQALLDEGKEGSFDFAFIGMAFPLLCQHACTQISLQHS